MLWLIQNPFNLLKEELIKSRPSQNSGKANYMPFNKNDYQIGNCFRLH